MRNNKEGLDYIINYWLNKSKNKTQELFEKYKKHIYELIFIKKIGLVNMN